MASKLKIPGVGMDPLSLLAGLPSFAGMGSPAGPSAADGTGTITNTMGSSFAVGSGASATTAPASAQPVDVIGKYLPLALMLFAAVAILKVVRK